MTETPTRRKINLELIEQMKELGHTQKQIAEELGVTRQAISWYVRYYGGTLKPRTKLLETHFPWKVPGEMCDTSLLRRLRDHGEYVATGGKDMSPLKLRRLTGFYRKLRTQVIEFDPAIPPEPGIAPNGGFALRKRTKKDGDLMIRVNKYTQQLTDEGRRIWALPQREGGNK